MLRSSRVTLGLLAVLRHELAKLPAATAHRLRVACADKFVAAGNAIDFLVRGHDAQSPPQQRRHGAHSNSGSNDKEGDEAALLHERRRRHRALYEAILREQARKAAAAEQAALAARPSWWGRLHYRVAQALRDARAAVSTRAGVMALLQHCAASHAAEVALEQGIDVKDVHLVVESRRRDMNNDTASVQASSDSSSSSATAALAHDDVIVGYIDAPHASDAAVAAFAQRLQRACPMARQMTIEWRHGTPPQQSYDTDTTAATTSSSLGAADYNSNNKVADTTTHTTPSQTHANDADGGVPAGMPGAWRRQRRDKHVADDDDDGDALHLPLHKRAASAATPQQQQQQTQQQTQQQQRRDAEQTRDGGGDATSDTHGLLYATTVAATTTTSPSDEQHDVCTSTSSTRPVRARWLRKPHDSNVLLDAHGTPLTRDEAAAVTTWRSHHAFSARCAHVTTDARDNDDDSDDVDNEKSWSVSFCVRAAADADMHVLLAIAPHYCAQTSVGNAYASYRADDNNKHDDDNNNDNNNDNNMDACAIDAEEQARYDERMLGTPLLWEEPYAIALECTRRGLFWWSDTWQLYGCPAATAATTEATSSATTSSAATTTCAADAAVAVAGEAAQYVRLQWRVSRPAKVTAQHTRTAHVRVAVARPHDAASQRRQWTTLHDVALPLDAVAATRLRFVPYVTLMDSGDEVCLIDDDDDDVVIIKVR